MSPVGTILVDAIHPKYRLIDLNFSKATTV
jgi:hypothetical protein